MIATDEIVQPIEISHDESERGELTEAWRRHHRMLSGLRDPNGVGWQGRSGWRGCFGLAMIYDSQFIIERQRLLVPNRSARWAVMLDIPTPHMGIARPVHFASVYRARLFYGSPKIDSTCVINTFDFNAKPGEAMDVRLFRVLNILNDAMTSFAVCIRHGWQPWLRQFGEYAGLSEGAKVILAGSKRFRPSECRSVADALPEPLIRVRQESMKQIWDRLTRHGSGYDYVLRDAFCRAAINGLAVHSPVAGIFTGTSTGVPVDGVGMQQLNFRDLASRKQHVSVTAGFQPALLKGSTVETGTIVGHEALNIPRAFAFWPSAKRWKHIAQLMRRNVLAVVVRTWFDAQLCRPLDDGSVLMPLALVGRDNAYAQNGELWWDAAPSCAPCREMFDQQSEALIFPPVWMDGWEAFRGMLGNALEFDLTPFSKRFRRAQRDRRGETANVPIFRDGATGDPGGETVPVVLDPNLTLAEFTDEEEIERVTLARQRHAVRKH